MASLAQPRQRPTRAQPLLMVQSNEPVAMVHEPRAVVQQAHKPAALHRPRQTAQEPRLTALHKPSPRPTVH